MPNKTIYVSDDDLPLLEQAQSLSGENQSATIVEALRQFVQHLETRKQGFHTIDVEVGKVTFKRKRFTGRLIASAQVAKHMKKRAVAVFGGRNGREFEGARTLDPAQTVERSDALGCEIYTVYQTIKGNYALHAETVPGRDSPIPHEKHLAVYPSLTDLQPHVPEDLYRYLSEQVKGNDVEVLDI